MTKNERGGHLVGETRASARRGLLSVFGCRLEGSGFYLYDNER